MSDPSDSLQAAWQELRFQTSDVLRTGLHGVDRVSGGIQPSSLTLAIADDQARDHVALQVATQAVGRQRQVVVVSPFEQAEVTLARVLLPPYGVRSVDVKGDASLRAAWAQHDLAVLAKGGRVRLDVFGASDDWPLTVRRMLHEESVDLLVILDVDQSVDEIRVLVAVSDGDSSSRVSLAMALRKLAKTHGTAVVVTQPSSGTAHSEWERASDAVIAVQPGTERDSGDQELPAAYRDRHLRRWRGKLRVTGVGRVLTSDTPSRLSSDSDEHTNAFDLTSMRQRRSQWLAETAVPLTSNMEGIHDGQVLRAQGVIVGVQSSVTARGLEWATVWLELDGAVFECQIFPSVYGSLDPMWLRSGAEIIVIARATVKSEHVGLHAEAVALPNAAERRCQL